MAPFSAPHFPGLKALAACGAIAIGSACVPSVAFAQNVVTDILSVPFAIAAAPFVAADAVIADPYYRYPAYSYRYAPVYYAYPPAYGMTCGYDRWDRWVCVSR
ncbi:MAG TPA: hypothetical protein VGI47_08310 [Candidatus Binataceae bacterium]